MLVTTYVRRGWWVVCWVMGVSKIGVPPKRMVYNGKPYWNGWFGSTTIFGNIHILRALGSEIISVFFGQKQQNAKGCLCTNIDFGVFWASWGGSGKKPGSGNRFRELVPEPVLGDRFCGSGEPVPGTGPRFRWVPTGFAVPRNGVPDTKVPGSKGIRFWEPEVLRRFRFPRFRSQGSESYFCNRKVYFCTLKAYFFNRKVYFCTLKAYLCNRKVYFCTLKAYFCTLEFCFCNRKVYFCTLKAYFCIRKVYFCKRKVYFCTLKFCFCNRKVYFCTLNANFGNRKVYFCTLKVYLCTRRVYFCTLKVYFGSRKVYFCTLKAYFCNRKVYFCTLKVYFGSRKVYFCTLKVYFCNRKVYFCTLKAYFF